MFRHYRQFEGMTERDVSEELRAQSAERKRRALARVEPVDLSATTWPEYPPSTVVNAITYAARRGLHRYLDRDTTALRSELAHALGVERERLVVGDGASNLLGATAQALLEPGDELITPWPSYGLYPVIARRARGHAVPVPGFGATAALRAVNERTRLVALCNPNDPTGELIGVDELRDLLRALPERVVVLLDEALRDFVGAEERDAALALTEELPRLLVFRTFSKAWGLAGLRVGYAIGGRAAAVDAERGRLARAVRALGADVAESQANFLWLGFGGLDGAELAHRLERHGVIVAAGGPLGDGDRVRAAVHRRE